MQYLPVRTASQARTLRAALEQLPVTPGGGGDEDVSALLSALEAARDALGRCEARVRDLSGTTRGGLRACGTTLRADGVCPAALTHLAPAKHRLIGQSTMREGVITWSRLTTCRTRSWTTCWACRSRQKVAEKIMPHAT